MTMTAVLVQVLEETRERRLERVLASASSLSFALGLEWASHGTRRAVLVLVLVLVLVVLLWA
jgi:hypothetical protein